MKKEEQITRRDIINIIFKNKWKIITVFLISFIVATIGSYVWPDKYTAQSKLLIKLGRETTPLPSGFTGGTVMVSKREEDINSEIEIIKSTFLISQVVNSMEADFNKPPEKPVTVIAKIKLQISSFAKSCKKIIEDGLDYVGLITKISPSEKLLKKVQKKLEVEPSQLTDVILISFAWKDPDITADFIKNLVDQYLEYHLKIHHSSKAFEFFETQAGLLKTKLNLSKDKLYLFQQLNDLFQFETKKLQLLAQVDSYLTSTQNLFAEIQKTKALVNSMQTELQAVPKQIILSEEEEYNPIVLSNLERQFADLITQEQELVHKYYPKNHRVVTIQSQIKLLKKQIKKEQNRIYGSSVSGVNKNWIDLNIRKIESKVQLVSLIAQFDAEKQNLLLVQNKLKKLRDIENRYFELKQQVDINTKNYLLYEDKMEQSRIEVAMDKDKLSSVRIIQPVMTPTKPVSPKKLLTIFLSLVFGTLGGISLSFFTEYIDTSISKPVDVDNIGIPFLGTITEH